VTRSPPPSSSLRPSTHCSHFVKSVDSPLALAVRQNKPKIVLLLLRAGADANQRAKARIILFLSLIELVGPNMFDARSRGRIVSMPSSPSRLWSRHVPPPGAVRPPPFPAFISHPPPSLPLLSQHDKTALDIATRSKNDKCVRLLKSFTVRTLPRPAVPLPPLLSFPLMVTRPSTGAGEGPS
jgi:ankyrin repeat protein